MNKAVKEMDKYPFEVSYDNECSEFVVRFKQFREVMGAGETIEEAVKEAFDNLEDYLDYCKEKNVIIPTPTNNVWLDDYSGKVTVRMPKALHRDLSEYCEKDGMSLNSTINDAIRAYLSKESLNSVTEEAVRGIRGAESRIVIVSYKSDAYGMKNEKEPQILGGLEISRDKNFNFVYKGAQYGQHQNN